MPNIKEMEFKDTKSPYIIHLDHGNNTVVLKYNKAILDERVIVPGLLSMYQKHLSHILGDIDWCIKKSFHKSDTERPSR